MPDSDDGEIDKWLNFVRSRVEQRAPTLLTIFDTYAGEARFGKALIGCDLAGLQGHARVLEVGAGALLLSCQLVQDGFDVTALEPVGQGFSHFSQLQEIVMECAETKSCLPHLVALPAEELATQSSFDYAFSINVMEHVADWPAVLGRVMASLKTGAKYRFTCANYLFPYEPHFNIPTLFSKRLTEIVLRSHILENKNMLDPEGTWRSLNWITVPAVEAIVAKMPGAHIVFDKSRLVATLERSVNDPLFASRRAAWVRSILGVLVRLKLHRLGALIPVAIQPIMDCTMTVVTSPKPLRPLT